MRVWSVMRHPSHSELRHLIPLIPEVKGNYQPHSAVDELYPGLEDDQTKAGMRRYYSMLNLAEVTRRYAYLVLDGEKNPTGRIAEEEDVKPATVRSWLHRAKKAGFYPFFGLSDS